jgi:hypothetical protein
MSAILATWESEIKRITASGQPGKISWDPHIWAQEHVPAIPSYVAQVVGHLSKQAQTSEFKSQYRQKYIENIETWGYWTKTH